MRKLNEIAGTAIILFLVVAIGYYKSNLARFLLAWGALSTAICVVIVKLKFTKKKRRGYFKG